MMTSPFFESRLPVGSSANKICGAFAIARSLINDPSILFADEPTGNLDSKNGVEVMNLLSELNQEGATIVMVTHSDRDAGYAHRVINLLDGKVLMEKMN